MPSSTDPTACADCGRPVCATCGEHTDDCDHGMIPSLEQELRLALLGAAHGHNPRSLDRLVTRFRLEARAEARVLLHEVANVFDRRAQAERSQGGQGSDGPPFCHGDVASALRLVADPPTDAS